MPHGRRALIDQVRALLTQQRYNSVVIHNYCRSAEHFLEYLARRAIAVDAATPDHMSGYLHNAGRRLRQRGATSAAVGNQFSRAGIHARRRLVQKRWPPDPSPFATDFLDPQIFQRALLTMDATLVKLCATPSSLFRR